MATIQEMLEAIGQFVDDSIVPASRFVARLIMSVIFVTIAAVPFLVMDYANTEHFWYYAGAYGVYLLGVARIIGR